MTRNLTDSLLLWDCAQFQSHCHIIPQIIKIFFFKIKAKSIDVSQGISIIDHWMIIIVHLVWLGTKHRGMKRRKSEANYKMKFLIFNNCDDEINFTFWNCWAQVWSQKSWRKIQRTYWHSNHNLNCSFPSISHIQVKTKTCLVLIFYEKELFCNKIEQLKYRKSV